MNLLGDQEIRVGIVVPTLGNRSTYLFESLNSIRNAGNSHICIVTPANVDLSGLESAGLFDSRVDDPMSGLPEAINFGFSSLLKSIEYIGWLGDDDLLEPGALDTTFQALSSNDAFAAVFGGCHYIDPSGKRILTNMSGNWAVPLISFGPDLIPQPGSLMRRSSFDAFGGLRSDLGWAFDVDLFINLKRQGKVKYLRQPLASFRWHPESLSVGQRANSVREASQVRVEYLPTGLKMISFIWEPLVRWATLRAGKILNNRMA